MDQKKLLIRIKRILEKKIMVDRVTLFGSRAKGTFHGDSDYDLAVISPDFKRMSFLERQQLVRPLVRKVLGNVALDVACYTEQEYERGKKAFLPSIIEKEGVAVT